MTGIAAVGIHDDLTSCQAAVPVGSADDKASGGVDEKLGFIIDHLCGQNGIEYISFDVFMDLFLSHIRVMLRGKHYRFQADRLLIFVIFHGDLALSVRSQIRKGAVLTYLGKLSHQLMGKADGIRHILFCFVGGKTEHHSLIACADGVKLGLSHFMLCRYLFFLFCLQSLIHAHGNVCGLFVQRHHNAAGIGVKSVFGLGITDFPYGIAYDFLDVHIGVCGDFAHHQNKARGGTGFTGHTAHGILLHQCVKHRIGNRIAHFIGMPFRYGFGCK